MTPDDKIAPEAKRYLVAAIVRALRAEVERTNDVEKENREAEAEADPAVQADAASRPASTAARRPAARTGRSRDRRTGRRRDRVRGTAGSAKAVAAAGNRPHGKTEKRDASTSAHAVRLRRRRDQRGPR